MARFNIIVRYKDRVRIMARFNIMIIVRYIRRGLGLDLELGLTLRLGIRTGLGLGLGLTLWVRVN